MTVRLVNPSNHTFGAAVITPRWLYVIAGATPASCGDPVLTDESLEPFDPAAVFPGDIVGIGIHTGNSLRGYEIGRLARARGAWVVFGGIHASLFPEEAAGNGGAHAVVRGDGDLAWGEVVRDCLAGAPRPVYEGGRIDAGDFAPARWDLLPHGRYMWGSVQTVRGCPKHCSFCSVWRMDGQVPRQRPVEAVVEEVVRLRRRGMSFIALSDDNFYTVTLSDLAAASRRGDTARRRRLEALRKERLDLLARLAQLPDDIIIFTQLTLEAAEDPAFLRAMRRAHIRGALVGVESVTPEGLKDIYKTFNPVGRELVERIRLFRSHGIYLLGSFVLGLPSDTPQTFEETVRVAEESMMAFAQFVPVTPFPGTVDFDRWAAQVDAEGRAVNGIPLSRHWLIPSTDRPKVYLPHPLMSDAEIRSRTLAAWNRFYTIGRIWRRSGFIKSRRGRLAFIFISRLFRQMYARTGIATDSARVQKATRRARWIAVPCRWLFSSRPMPELEMPPPPAMEVAEP